MKAFTVLLMFVCLAVGGVACANPVESAATLPGNVISGVGDFIHKVMTAPAGEPVNYHDLTGSKTAVKMRFAGPQPTLALFSMRDCSAAKSCTDR